LLLIVFFLSPESPRFLGKIGKWDEAKKNLCNLRGLPEDSEDITVSHLEYNYVVMKADFSARDGPG
jgi:hypothetical protein